MINLNTTDKKKNAVLSLKDMDTMNQDMFKQKYIQEKVISAEGHFQKKKKTIKYSQATGNEVIMNRN